MYRSKGMGWLKHADFMLLDCLCVILAFLISFFLRLGVRNGINFECFRYLFSRPQYTIMLLLYPFVHIFLVILYSAYRNVLKRGLWVEFKATLTHCALIFVIIISFMFLTKQSDLYSRTIVILTFFFSTLLMYSMRLLHKRLLKKNKRGSKKLDSYIVIAEPDNAAETIETLRSNNNGDFYITGAVIFGQDMTGQEIDGVPVIASEDTWEDYLIRNIVDEVYIRLDRTGGIKEKIEYIISSGATAHLILDIDSFDAPNKIVQSVNGLNVVSASLNTSTPRQRLIKRLTDICFGLIGSVATIILTVLIGPLIFLEDFGPIFFLQKRVGRNGRIFNIIKFRTMYTDAEKRKAELMDQNEMKGKIFKMKNDPRITKIGKILRKTSLDELPQSFNILFGSMSVVGTRPPTLDEYNDYESHHKVRLGITPGLTGMWQVSGRNKIEDFEEIVRLDEKYIREWSLALDARIILKTFVVVLTREGAE